jgi:hypothetical protein
MQVVVWLLILPAIQHLPLCISVDFSA